MSIIIDSDTAKLFEKIFTENHCYVIIKIQFKNEGFTKNKYININNIPKTLDDIITFLDTNGKEIYNKFIQHNNSCEFDFMKKQLVITYIIKKSDCDIMNILYEAHTLDGKELIFY